MRRNHKLNELAGIQYMGSEGITSHCLKSITRLIQFGDKINKAKIITFELNHGAEHAFLLDINYSEYLVIKSGFSSGYGGEGPRGFSEALRLLEQHNIELEEYCVNEDFMNRLNQSALMKVDIEFLENERNIVRPYRYSSYILEPISNNNSDGHDINSLFPPTPPFGAVDPRIMDLAIRLHVQPDFTLNTGYRRLETIIREKSKLNLHGTKLFSKAFLGIKSKLYWEDENISEEEGKANLFTSIFKAYRNKRAHQEFFSKPNEVLREFLLINELFILESTSVLRPEIIEEELVLEKD